MRIGFFEDDTSRNNIVSEAGYYQWLGNVKDCGKEVPFVEGIKYRFERF